MEALDSRGKLFMRILIQESNVLSKSLTLAYSYLKANDKRNATPALKLVVLMRALNSVSKNEQEPIQLGKVQRILQEFSQVQDLESWASHLYSSDATYTEHRHEPSMAQRQHMEQILDMDTRQSKSVADTTERKARGMVTFEQDFLNDSVNVEQFQSGYFVDAMAHGLGNEQELAETSTGYFPHTLNTFTGTFPTDLPRSMPTIEMSSIYHQNEHLTIDDLSHSIHERVNMNTFKISLADHKPLVRRCLYNWYR